MRFPILYSQQERGIVMSTRFSSNSKVIEAVKTLVAKCNATGDVSVLPEGCDRADDLIELVRHGNHFGYDIRNYGFEGYRILQYANLLV